MTYFEALEEKIHDSKKYWRCSVTINDVMKSGSDVIQHYYIILFEICNNVFICGALSERERDYILLFLF